MKQFFYKSMSVFMAAVVLLTTMSFTIDMHYCGESLVDFSFVQNVKTCGMEKAQATSSCENPMLSEKSCCTDKQLIKRGQDDLKISFNQPILEFQVFVASFTYSYLSLFEDTESKDLPFFDYPPPFVKRDVQVLHQTFLI